MNTLMEKVIKTEELVSGQLKTVSVNGAPVALAHIGDSFFATSDTCSHAQCSLGTDGLLTGSSVMCGCHGASFDMKSGKVMTLPATKDIGTYTVEVRDGWVYVGEKI